MNHKNPSNVLVTLGWIPCLALFGVTASAAELPVPLGSAGNFTILAGTTVTNAATAGTVITGDVGVSPGSAVTGFPPGVVVGTIHVADPAAAQAQLDLTVAYNDAAGRATAPTLVAGNIGGTTLFPGLYKSTDSLEISSGDLTLDAQGDPTAVYVFQVQTTLQATSGRQVILAGGAQAANIFWQVGSSATLGTTSVFKGNILANISISLQTGASLEGRALARTGAVTLDGNGATMPVLIVPTPTPSPTPTSTPSDTPSPTPSNTPSPTPSLTPSGTPSPTPSPTPSNTPSPTPSPTPSLTPSDTPSPTPSPTPSLTPSDTPSPTPSSTPSPSPSPSLTPSNTPSPTPSLTPSDTPSPTPSPTPSLTPSNTPSPTPSPTPSLTPSNTSSPTPTSTPSATPSPEPSPTPSATPTPCSPCVDYEFLDDTQGWISHTLQVFTSPDLAYNPTPPGSLDITATDNQFNFGYWESPVFQLVSPSNAPRPDAIPLIVPSLSGTNLYSATFNLQGDAPDRSVVPEIRLRTTAENSQQADLIVIDSINAGGISPYLRDRTTASLYFMPAAGSPDFRFQFDMLNFSLLQDSPSATVGLDSVSICFFPDGMPAARTEADITFVSSNQNWTTTAPSVFQAPDFSYDATGGRLAIATVAPSGRFEFGYWGSSEVEPLVHPVTERLYFAEFTVESDQVEASLVPNFRVRINDSGFRAAQYVQISSTGPAFNSPTLGHPKTYTVFYPPNVGTDGAYLIYSFDIVTQDTDGDSTSAMLWLSEVRVRSVALPIATTPSARNHFSSVLPASNP